MLVGVGVSFLELTQFYVRNWSAAPFVGFRNYLDGLDPSGPIGGALAQSFLITFAYTVLAANKEARLAGAHATVQAASVKLVLTSTWVSVIVPARLSPAAYGSRLKSLRPSSFRVLVQEE